jgi:hypothetical protein
MFEKVILAARPTDAENVRPGCEGVLALDTGHLLASLGEITQAETAA